MLRRGTRVVWNGNVDLTYGPMRQDIKVGATGIITRPYEGRPAIYWVLFDGQNEAMTMQETELNVV